MNEPVRHQLRPATGLACFFVLAALAGCAGAGAGHGGGAASIAGGKFTPSAAPAANFGADPSRKCASNPIADDVQTDAAGEAARARKPTPRTDGRLCAMAEALLAWDDKQQVPEKLNFFLAQYFGLAQSVPRVVVGELPPENQPDTVARISDIIKDYVRTGSNVQYGLATTRLRKGPIDKSAVAQGASAPTPIKMALVMQDVTLELDPLPRKLDPAAQATVKGKLLGNLQNPKILISDARGKLQQPPEQKGKDFSAPVSCDGRTGRVVVEIRAEESGSPKAIADLPVLCGMDPPTSVELPVAEGGPAQQERAIFDRINQERTAAGLQPLTWDDRVAQAARSASVAEAQAAGGGGGSTVTAQQMEQRLREAGIASGMVLQNPAQSRTAAGAHDRFELSPVHRGNYMNPDATHGAVGIALFKAQDAEFAVVNEVFVRQQAAVDVATVRPKVRSAIEKNRAAAGAPPFKDDPALEKVAEEYAKELAAAGGEISNARHSQLVTPLYRSFRTVDLISGPQLDPTGVADEKTVLNTKEKLIGLGVAQGDHKTLGKNVFYVVLIFGTKK